MSVTSKDQSIMKCLLLILLAVCIVKCSDSTSRDVAQDEADKAAPISTTETSSSSATDVSSSLTVEATDSSTTSSQTVSATSTSAPVPESRTRRLKKRAAKVYKRAKAKAAKRGSYYLVDYALSLRVIAGIFSPNSTASNSTQAGASNSTQTDAGNSTQTDAGSSALNSNDTMTLSQQEKILLTDAVKNFLLPLSTMQKAQKSEDEDKISGSLLGMLDLLIEKSGSTVSSEKIKDGDWKAGQIWTSVVRREHVDLVMKSREQIMSISSKTNITADQLSQQDQSRLVRARDYYSSLSPSSDDFTRLINPHVDLFKFGERYVDLIESVLLRRPDLVSRCRLYLAKYLSTGNSQDGYYKNLVADANMVQPVGRQASGAASLAPRVGLLLVSAVAFYLFLV